MKKAKTHLLIDAKTFVSTFCIAAFLISMIPIFSFATDPKSALRTVWENPFTQTTFHSSNEVNSTFYTFPKVIWDGSRYVDFVYNSSDMSAGIGSVYIKVFPDHTVFYDPYQTEERIGRESWTVEYYNASSSMWTTDNPVEEHARSLSNSSGIYFARTANLETGSMLEEWYWLSIGSKMKITIILNPAQSAEYRLLWLLDNVVGTKARWLTTAENVTSQTVRDILCSQVQFGTENESKTMVDWSDASYINETTRERETYFQELKMQKDTTDDFCQAAITFGNFPVTSETPLVLDPTVQTLNSTGTLDGYIARYGPTYPPQQGANVDTSAVFTVIGVEGKTYGGLNYYQCRTYLSFDTSPIPALAYNISSTLKIKTYEFDSTENFTVKVWGGNQTVFENNLTIMDGTQPIYGNSLTADSWGKGRVQTSTWDTTDYQTGIYINLTVPSNQINKAGSTQFELNSSVEDTEPGPDVVKYVYFYSGDSRGNEPKLEVSYNIDTMTVGTETWFYRSVSNSKAVIVIFGAENLADTSLRIKSIDFSTEKNPGKILFTDALIGNGSSIFTPSHDSSNQDHTYYQNDSTWVQDLVVWLISNQTYTHVWLFGFSGGGVVVGNEIQKDYATQLSGAVMNCAPVNWSAHSGQIWHTALTASKAKVATCFPENVQDSLDQTPPFYQQEKDYYDNARAVVDTEWHNWTGGHGDFFEPNKTCLWHTPNWPSGENDSVAVINWFNAAHPPSTPFTPSGPNGNYTITSYGFTSGTVDPNGDNVTYEFDWGDNTNSNTSYVVSGTNVTVYHAWNSTGTYNVTVRAEDATNWSAWSQPKTMTINYLRGPGDVNHDNIVDIYDAIILSAAFNSVPGNQNWNSDADLKIDNVIDIYDALILSGKFGNNYTGYSGCDSPGQSPLGGASTDSGTSILVDPGQITVFKDEVFNANVNIASVTDLAGWEFKLYWNNTVLNCINATLQSPVEWQGYTQDYGNGTENSYNATNGRFWKAETAAYPAPSFNGSMTIATLTFQAMQPGTTSLTLTETMLGNSTAQPIDHTDSSGSVTVYYGRYMRSDTQQINGLSAYKLDVPQSTSSVVNTQSGSGMGAEWGIRAWVRHSNGVEQEISLDGQTGTPTATVGGGSAGIKSNTVSVAQTTLQSTDSLVIRVYVQIADGSWNLCATFTTGQLQATTLNATTWTVYYYTFSTYNRVTGRTTGSFYWGTTNYNSRIQNLQYS